MCDCERCHKEKNAKSISEKKNKEVGENRITLEKKETCDCRRCRAGKTTAEKKNKIVVEKKYVKEKSTLTGPQASLNLDGSANNSCYTVDSFQWGITNNGLYDIDNNIVNWTINVTKNNVLAPKKLKINGVLKITNNGNGDADIGNIIVNLQRQVSSGTKWSTFTSDVADVTNGDLYYSTANKTGYNVPAASSEGLGFFAENRFSGPLNFYNSDNNSIFSLVGGFKILAGQSVTLLYQAIFFIDDPTLTKFRVETMVTFGNAGTRGGSNAVGDNIPYRGDGILYNNVRSVPTRVSMNMPVLDVCEQTATLSSALSDTTVNFGGFVNYNSDIGLNGSEVLSNSAVSHVSVQPDPQFMTEDRTFINCAYLTSQPEMMPLIVLSPLDNITILGTYYFTCCEGFELVASNDVIVPGTGGGNDGGGPPTGYTTYTQGGWGAAPRGNNPGQILSTNFSTVFPSGVLIGKLPSNYINFTTALAITNFLPQGGTASFFNISELSNPISTSAGVFAGQVLALTLNIQFNLSGVVGKPGFGNLIFVDFNLSTFVNNATKAWLLAGPKTVSQFLDACNQAIGGGGLPSGLTFADLNNVADELNKDTFDNGIAGTFVFNLQEP